jgi:uncharacterized oxidoreductase
MKTKGNTVLITGGATGIGFAMAESFVKAGNEVIICGRRENRLKEAKDKLPTINFKKCDLSKDKERKALYDWASSNFKKLNILVNNAGIQRTIDLKKGTTELLKGEDEIEINLKAPVHLSAYFIPLLSKQNEAAIINVSSGLGYIPMALFPVYCATKAALHLFSVSLRHQLRNTPIKVFEVIPPMVDTELNKESRDRQPDLDRGVPPSEVAKDLMKAMEKNQFDVAVGESKGLVMGARKNPEEMFKNLNSF